MYDTEFGVDLDEIPQPLMPEDFDQFETDPVWIALVREFRRRQKQVEQIRDDPSQPDHTMRYMVGCLAGLQEFVNIYKGLKANVSAGELYEEMRQRNAASGQSDFERAMNAARNYGDHENGNTANKRIQSPSGRQWLPG